MTRLDEFADNDEYTVDGEAGIIRHIFATIGAGARVVVDFGAGDGDSCSNTAPLWRTGWKALLIEPDGDRFQDLEGNALPFDTICQQRFLTPTGPNSISQVVTEVGLDTIDFMSIDVDGDDLAIFEQMTCRPRVICIEFNPTIPSFMDIRQPQIGEGFGASLLAIVRVGQALGYRFIGATRCNAFFVIEAEAAPFDSYERDPQVLFPLNGYTFAITDYQGRVVLCGQPLPWEAKEPYVLPLNASTNIMPMTMSPQHLRRGFESLWGPAAWVSSSTPNGLSPKLLELILSGKPTLVCVDLSNEAAETKEWLFEFGEPRGYRTIVAGCVMGLIPQ